MVDSVLKPGEFGDFYHHNKRQWNYEKQLEDGDYVKIKVSDHLKNTQTYTFRVKVDPSIKMESSDQRQSPPAEMPKKVDHTFTNDLDVRSLFENFKGEGIVSELDLMKELTRLTPGYSIQLLELSLANQQDGVHMAQLLVQKENRYQYFNLKWTSDKVKHDQSPEVGDHIRTPERIKETPLKKTKSETRALEKQDSEPLRDSAVNPKTLKQVMLQQNESASASMLPNQVSPFSEETSLKMETKANANSLPKTGDTPRLLPISLGFLMASLTSLFRKKRNE
ncbi:LPXTG cell wall anchor domain-containing protein [Streptococcus rupicaprae]